MNLSNKKMVFGGGIVETGKEITIQQKYLT